MSRKEIIRELSEYFDIQELVGPIEYLKFGNNCWRYLRTDLLHTILVVRRDILKVPMYVNNWATGGNLYERGLRCNISPISKDKTVENVLYMSGHSFGAAIDFDAKGMTAESVRKKIIMNESLLPYPIRLEKGVSWVHLDVYDDIINNKKITLF